MSSFANIDKDSFDILLWSLSPADALSVRATCRQLNVLVCNSQTYWFYKYKAYKGKTSRSANEEEKQIAQHKLVHIVPIGWTCINTLGVNGTFQLLSKHYPENAIIAHTELQISNIPPNHNNYWHIKGTFQRMAISQIMHLLSNIQEFKCPRPNHHAHIYGEIMTPQLCSEEMQKTEGLFIYHYLFECFHNQRAQISRVSKYSSDQRKNLIDTKQNQIQNLKNQIANLQNELWLLKNFEQIQKDSKTCPFNRKSADKYLGGGNTSNTSNMSNTSGKKKSKIPKHLTKC